ncbi:MAG: PmoA family protein, partial [Puniceicoccales bacterium]|nr:PmoA family protein [Puniceicoccales bacterium]
MSTHPYTRSFIAALLALFFLPSAAFAEWDDSRPGQFAFQRDGKDVWRFHFDAKGGDTKPFFDPVGIAGGPSLTWARPKDHVWHLGLWFSWKYINGVNYWEESAGKSSGETRWTIPEITRNSDGAATLALALEYIPRPRKAPANAPAPVPVLTEARTISFSAPATDGSYFMDWTQVFTAHTDIKLDRTPPSFSQKGTPWGGYAGLSIRYAAALSDVATVASTVGRVPRDSRKRLDVFGDRAVEQNGLIADAPYGIAILAHPGNFRAPGDWYPIQSEKHFNYLNASPLLTAPFFVAKGETFTLRYRVHVHPGRWDAAQLRAAADAYTGAPAPKTGEPFNVLVYSRTNDFRHDEAIAAAIPFLKRAGTIHNFTVDATEDATRFTPETLKKYRAVILLYTSGEFLADKLPPSATPEALEAAKAQLLARRAAFESYVSGGGALVGIHTTTEFGAKWEEFGKIIGGYFTDHPKHQTAEIVKADAAHPAVS